MFQVLRSLGIELVNHLVDGDGKVHSADFRIWRSLILTTVCVPPLQSAPLICAGSVRHECGLSDHQIVVCAQALLRSFQPYLSEQILLVKPLTASGLLKGEDALTCWAVDICPGIIVSVFPFDNHWALLVGLRSGECITWTLLDGLKGRTTAAATYLAECIACQLRCTSEGPYEHILVPQDDAWTCGTVAVVHLCHFFGLHGVFTRYDVSSLHAWIHEHIPCIGSLVACGPPGRAEVVASLSTLLHEKGVPGPEARQRAQQTIEKLGFPNVQQAMHSKNAWTKLKAEASRPGVMFRLVLPHELTEHVNAKASDQFGAKLGKKHKKTNDKSQPFNPVCPDPQLLELFPGHFVDEDDKVIPVLDFESVTSDSRGIALCSAKQAMPYIAANKHISVDALALALTEMPQDDEARKQVESIVVPAKYRGTSEPVLLFGGLLQIGDAKVKRAPDATSKANLEVVATSVIRVQIFRDQLQLE